jgi:hypothetical protein
LWHAPDRTDLAFPDFFLFGLLKEKLQEVVLRSGEAGISEI